MLNEHWPTNPQAIRRRDDEAKPVRARVVFAEDGEQWLEGRPLRWNDSYVWVELDDQRVSTNGAWLKPRTCTGCRTYRNEWDAPRS